MKRHEILPLMAALALAAWAAGCASNDSGLQRCRNIQDRDRRLACFDATGEASEPSASANRGTEQSEEFGLEHLRRLPEASALTARLSKSRRDPYGKLILTLDNGQVWKQTDDRRLYIKGEEPRVTISRRILGSFSLKVEGASTTISVKRVR